LAADEWESGIAAELQDVVEPAPDDALVLVDIPIGLRNAEAAARDCDSAARRLLGNRASSIFNAPLRPVLGLDTYPAANARSREICGKGLSKQSFFIGAKIHEVDVLMRGSEKARGMIRESHPELCFWGLSGGQPMTHGKKTEAGFSERLDLLEALSPGIGHHVESALARYSRKQLARDDVLDAAVLGLVASGVGTLRQVPEEAVIDSCGLPMQITYGYRDPG
jgi:predicted RNase H-like nuclease